MSRYDSDKKKERIIPNDYEIDVLEDFYVSAEMNLVGKKVVFISVYNYIGPNDNEFFKFLENMLNYIRNNKNRKQTIIIIGGDFNMDERFQGNYKRLGLLAGKMKREFHQIGYHEILSDKLNQKRFTFISPTNKKPYQLDYLFIPKEIKVNKITIGNKNEIFNQKPRLSDHLPIIATIEV